MVAASLRPATLPALTAGIEQAMVPDSNGPPGGRANLVHLPTLRIRVHFSVNSGVKVAAMNADPEVMRNLGGPISKSAEATQS